MKRRIKLKPLAKVILAILFVLIALYLFLEPFKPHTKSKTTQPKEIIAQKEKVVYEPKNDVSEVAEEKQEDYQEPIQDTYTTRMTSFWANDGYGTGECTGSGLCSWNFEINDKGWYTYQGKLVVATATTYLANQGWFVGEGVHLYKYGDELTLTIDGIEYDAIVKDSCGNCCKTDRIDLFVKNADSVKDTIIQVKIK